MEDAARRMWLAGAGLLGAAAVARRATAGNLNPPPGPVTPTMRTLDQIEPRIPVDAAHTPGLSANEAYTIAAAGSYYLTGNLSAANTYVIHIAAAGVTLDLRGFAITGNGANTCIVIDAAADRCTIHDGSLSACAYGVVDLGSHGSILRGIAVGGSTTEGIKGGFGSTIDSCSVHGASGFIGIHVYDGSVVTRSTVCNGTAGYGIAAEAGSTVAHCAVRSNVFGGAPTGFEAAIWTGSGCAVLGCTVIGNTGVAGILVNSGSTVAQCSVINQSGVNAGSAGILAGGQCTVTECTVRGLAAAAGTPHGFLLLAGCDVSGCTAAGNRGDGFQYDSNCLLTGNVARSNGAGGTAHGFHGTGSGNRIDGNLASGNTGTGILASSATADQIVRNTSSGNGVNYNPSSGTAFGPLGNPGTATSPWANF